MGITTVQVKHQCKTDYAHKKERNINNNRYIHIITNWNIGNNTSYPFNPLPLPFMLTWPDTLDHFLNAFY
jgi:hypothetical protein